MKASKINLHRFLDFCKGFDLFSGIAGLSEKPGAKKGNRFIYQFVFLMCVYGRSSFLSMDQGGRFEKLKRLFKLARFENSRYRHTVVSDTTLTRRLEEMDRGEIRRINYTTLLAALRLGLVFPTAIVDGTQWCSRLYSCLCFVTRWGDVWMVDCEPIEKKGKELLASQRLLERCCERIGKGVIKLLLADMLYFNERFWQLRESGYVADILVKYTPDPKTPVSELYRIVLQRFESMKSLYIKPEKSKKEREKLFRLGFDSREGYDPDHGISYTIYYCRNNSWDNRYQIAQVIEKSSAKGMMTPFYVITTDKSMKPQALRENGHKRWYIENDGFKQLNAHLESKRCWSKQKTLLENLIGIWMLAFSLLCLFRREYQHQIRNLYHQVKVTLAFVTEILEKEAFAKASLHGI